MLSLNICIFLVNCVLLGILIYRNHVRAKRNTEIIQDNFKLQKENEVLLNTISYNKNEIASQLTHLNSIIEQSNQLKEDLENSANELYEKSIEVANEKMSNAAEKMSQEYQEAEQKAQDEYLQLMNESVNEYQNTITEQKTTVKTLAENIQQLQSTFHAAMEAAKRFESTLFQTDFYRLQLTPIDIDEIKRLREVESFLRDPEPLNKVIYKVYYEIPTNDLIGRVLGSDPICGIYKITHIDSKRCYVGQSACVQTRWKQHIKRGVGAEQATRNKLYPAMQKHGVENFTFELVESCPREQLDEREDYWQEFFGAKEFGYSIK